MPKQLCMRWLISSGECFQRRISTHTISAPIRECVAAWTRVSWRGLAVEFRDTRQMQLGGLSDKGHSLRSSSLPKGYLQIRQTEHLAFRLRFEHPSMGNRR